MNSRSSHQVSEALGLWEPKRTLTLEAARRHSARIRYMRYGLIVMALLLVFAMTWEFTRQGQTVFPPDNPNESVKMVNPRYSGRTESGLPFYLTAKDAIRKTADATSVELTNPVLEFLRNKTADKSLVVAETGTWDDINKVLHLRQAVDLSTDDGYECQTTHARIWATSNIIEGDEPIHCTGAMGSVKGNSFEIINNYKTYIFKDGMNAVLEEQEE